MGKMKELEKRVTFLEEFLLGMSREGAQQFLENYTEACKNLKGGELDSYIEANNRAVWMAEKLLGGVR